MTSDRFPINESWFAEVLAGECDAESLAAFQAWLDEDGEHRLTFSAYQRLWQALAPRQAPACDLFEGWCRLAAQLHLGSDQPEAWSLYLEGALSPQETAQLEAWRAADPDNERAFVAYQSLWQAATPAAEPSFDVAAGWARVAESLELSNAPQQAPVVAMPARRRWLALSGALAAVLVLGLLLNRFAFTPAALTVVETVAGQQKQVTLPDGSQVWLNAGTRLTYPPAFDATTRTVSLQGQAYFEVVHRDVLPFRVQTDEAVVTVLGTRFDVHSRHRRTRVVVRDGRVALRGRDQKARVILGQDQMSTVQSGGRPAAVQAVDANEAIAWREGFISFERARLADALVELSLTFDRQIILDDPALGERTMSGTFPTESLEAVLTEIGLALNLEYTVKAGVYHIHTPR